MSVAGPQPDDTTERITVICSECLRPFCLPASKVHEIRGAREGDGAELGANAGHDRPAGGDAE